jgi:hypothetical protein
VRHPFVPKIVELGAPFEAEFVPQPFAHVVERLVQVDENDADRVVAGTVDGSNKSCEDGISFWKK